MAEHAELKRLSIANTLRACQLFAGLPPSDLEAISAFSNTRNLGKGEYLFHEGDESDGFYVVQRGAIDVHRIGATGKEQVIHVFRPGDSFAEASLAAPAAYPVDARALEPSTVVLIPKIDFVALLRDRPDLSLRMLSSMSQHLRVLVGLLDDLTLKDVETRLIHWLLHRCPVDRRGQPVEIPLDRSKRVLAAELNTASETLSRTFAKLRDRQLIRSQGRTITVLRPSELEALFRRHMGEL